MPSHFRVIFPELGFKVRYIFVDVLVLLSCSEHGNHEKKETFDRRTSLVGGIIALDETNYSRLSYRSCWLISLCSDDANVFLYLE